ncbi:MAG: homoserine kinase [Woeseiaceae bacterium]|nr:homoserine kinase [Woeseiaceae bacterium]
MADAATAFAPASIGNLGVGFDMLGLALEGVGDRVTVRRSATPGVTVAEVRGLDGEQHPYLSTDASQNTASIAARSLWEAAGDGGIEIVVHKGVPLQSGMGSSAASAVAAVVAANALLPQPRSPEQLLMHAIDGERFASGGLHADNVAPSLFGGLVLCPAALLPRALRIDPPTGVSAVLLHPELQVDTAKSRRALGRSITRELWLEQQGCLAGFIAACYRNDVPLMRATLRDVVIEPQRAASVACFDAVRNAAERGGAIGCSLSGSGPSIFALGESQHAANLAASMAQACRGLGIECQTWVSSLNAPGAFVEN